MKVKELIRLLEKLEPEQEIGVEEYGPSRLILPIVGINEHPQNPIIIDHEYLTGGIVYGIESEKEYRDPYLKE